MRDSDHLQFIHNRMINIHNENINVDYLIRMREIIKTMSADEGAFVDYKKYLVNKNKK